MGASLGRIAFAFQQYGIFLLKMLALLPGMIATFFILLWTALPFLVAFILLGIPLVIFANNQCSVLQQLDVILQVNNEALNVFRDSVNVVLDIISPLLYINNAFWDFVFHFWADMLYLLGCQNGQRCTAFEDIIEFFNYIVGFLEEIFLIVYNNVKDILLNVDWYPLSNEEGGRMPISELASRLRNSTLVSGKDLPSGDPFVEAIIGMVTFLSNPVIFEELYEILKTIVEAGIAWATQLIQLFITDIGPAFQWMKDNIFSGFLGNVFIAGFTQIQQTVEVAINFFSTVFPQLLATLANFFASLPGIISNAIASALEHGIGSVGGLVSGALGSIGLSAKRDALSDAEMFPAIPPPSAILPPPGFAYPNGWTEFASSTVSIATVPPCSAVLNSFDSYYYMSASFVERTVLYACAALLEAESSFNRTPTVPLSVLQARSRVYAERVSALVQSGAIPFDEKPLYTFATMEAPTRRSRRRDVPETSAPKPSVSERIAALASHPGLDDVKRHWRTFLERTKNSAAPASTAPPVPTSAASFEPSPNRTLSPAAQHFWAFLGTNPSREQIGEFLVHNRYLGATKEERVSAKFSLSDIFNPGGIVGTITLPSINIGAFLNNVYNALFHCDRSAAPAYYCLPYINPQPQIGPIDITIHWGTCCAPCVDCTAYQNSWSELVYLIRLATNGAVQTIDKALQPFFAVPVIGWLFGAIWWLVSAIFAFPTNAPPATGLFCFIVNIGYLVLMIPATILVIIALAAFGMIVMGTLIFAVELIFAILALLLFFIWGFIYMAFMLICCCNIPTLEQRVETVEVQVKELQHAFDANTQSMFTTALQHPRMFETPAAQLLKATGWRFGGGSKKPHLP